MFVYLTKIDAQLIVCLQSMRIRVLDSKPGKLQFVWSEEIVAI